MRQPLELGQTEDVDRGLGSSADDPLQLLNLKLRLFSCRGHQRTAFTSPDAVMYRLYIYKIKHSTDDLNGGR